MAIVDLIMPKMGESIMEATVLRWHKNVGDTVQLDETLLEIATDKVDSEVPSTANGTIVEILFKENDVVPVGAVIARIESVAANINTIISPPPPPAQQVQQTLPIYTPPPPPVETIPYIPQPVQAFPKIGSGNNKFFSPLVLNIANSEGLNLSELERITGTGADGRVSKKDVIQYIADKKAGKIPAFVAPQPQPVYNPPPTAQQPAFVSPVVPAPIPVIATPVVPVVQPQPIVETPIQQPARFEAPKTEPVFIQPAPEPIIVPQTAIQPTIAEPVVQAATIPTTVQYEAPKASPYIPPVATTTHSIEQPNAIKQEKPYVQPPLVEAPKQTVEIIEMDRMRKLIAKHMVESKQTSPHVTSFVEADVTNMVMWRNKKKDDFEKRTGTKITYTPMFIECIIKVMKKYPIINSSVEGDKIIIKNYFNIGMATALPNNNLIVPVIKNAEQLGLVGLAKSVNALAENARNNKLKPEDVQGGTFTLTNVGTFGSLMGTPIINQPQVAILAVGVIKKRPVVVETEKGDFIGIRHMMYLSLSYDHRIVDGSVGASFLTDVAKEFENWDINRELKLVVQEQYVD
jgi:2-oxoglutarate dehydrogenase E2 component (dihydrolipoamide succinyltransferase)